MQDFIQSYRLDRHGLLHQPIEQLAAAHRFATIKPKREFVQVVVQMLMAHRIRCNSSALAPFFWAVIMGGYPILDLNFIARCAADWTRETLTRNNTEWLSNLPQGPLRPLGRKVDCVHGSPRNEDEYVLSEATASFALSATRARIIFCGHTHEQFGFASIQCELAILKPSFQSTDDADSFAVPLSETERYLLNPGSVGQPRDHDWRASFAIYDDAQSLLTWYRVPYDLTTAQVRIRKAGLPFVLATRLGIGA